MPFPGVCCIAIIICFRNLSDDEIPMTAVSIQQHNYYDFNLSSLDLRKQTKTNTFLQWLLRERFSRFLLLSNERTQFFSLLCCLCWRFLQAAWGFTGDIVNFPKSVLFAFMRDLLNTLLMETNCFQTTFFCLFHDANML